ncbi:hypothetical protein RhiirC2_790695 [Rhizophagus irregularis]|uniref:Uncharacterized protein n=1 Tax=Rhizophagus irregularis TaxID=588596 RepID=A0A2N1MKR8_9GLOM|nr:hypothetical protein RhiirC2_790695 [Rhizophagus irregularis]
MALLGCFTAVATIPQKYINEEHIVEGHDFKFTIEDKIFQEVRRNSCRNFNYLSSFPMCKG